MNNQLNIFEAKAERDKGITRATTHADSVIPEWSSRAFEELKRFVASNPGEFMGEDFRAHCAVVDFPLPPHARAFGGVIARAAKAGIIKRVGISQVKNAKAHCANAAVWIQCKKIA